jgi:hypothetical protein
VCVCVCVCVCSREDEYRVLRPVLVLEFDSRRRHEQEFERE